MHGCCNKQHTMTASHCRHTHLLPVLLYCTPHNHAPRRNSVILSSQCFVQLYSMSKLYSISNSKRMTSFFTYTSGRARRKRKQRLLLLQKEKRKNEEIFKTFDSNHDPIDNRTVMDILFPNPFKGMAVPEQPKWPTTLAKWREIFSLAWRDYKATWEGFTTSKGIFGGSDQTADEEEQKQNRKDTIEATKNEILRNVKRNRRFLQVGAIKLRDEVRTRTGITSFEDLKKYAADAMRLANECLQQFMLGYRKGRDDEVEKMLTQYFQQLEQKAIQEAEKKPRRKIKRRIMNRYHPLQ